MKSITILAVATLKRPIPLALVVLAAAACGPTAGSSPSGGETWKAGTFQVLNCNSNGWDVQIANSSSAPQTVTAAVGMDPAMFWPIGAGAGAPQETISAGTTAEYELTDDGALTVGQVDCSAQVEIDAS